MKTNNTTLILGSIGALGGLYYAFKKGKGFWGYAGFFVLGSIAGHLAGNVVTSVIPKPKTDGTKNTKTETDTDTDTETKEEVSSATGKPMGGSCQHPSQAVCKDVCENKLGGTYGEGNKCYKNGVAISGGIFGGGKSLRNTKTRN